MSVLKTATSRGIFLTLITSMLWGSAFLFIGIGFEYTDPYTLAFMRFAVASVVILPVSLFSRSMQIMSELRRKEIWILGAIYALGFLFQFTGQAASTAAEASLLSCLFPVIVPILAVAFLKDRISTFQKISTVLGFSGLLIVMIPNLSGGSVHLLGDVVLFLSSVFYAVFIVLGKKKGISATDSTFSLIIIVTIFLAPFAILFGHLQNLLVVTWMGWFAILWLAIPSTLVATALYMKGLSYLTASTSATLLFAELVTGFVLSVMVFGEPYVLIRSIGAAIISVSIIISAIGSTGKTAGGTGADAQATVAADPASVKLGNE